MKQFFIFFLFLLPFQVSSEEIKEYFEPLTDQEKESIRYIIRTLSEHSPLSLFFYKASLNRAGNKIQHVHTLKIVLFIFTDPELKNKVKTIPRLTWNRFAQDMGEGLQRAANRNDMRKDYLDDFVEKTGIDKSRITPSVNNNRWVQFLDIVRNQKDKA